MALEIEGKVVMLLPEQSGTSGKTGKEWRKQGFVIETQEQYPKKAVFNVWNDTVDAVKQLASGTKVKVSFRIESREYNERWYTDLTAWKIARVDEKDITGGNDRNNTPPPDETIYNDNNSSTENIDIKADKSEGDDLPF